MKALSLRQPWATLIARGYKTIETRLWASKWRGPVLICAAKFMPRGARFGPAFEQLLPESLPLGVALCVVDIVDIRPMTHDDTRRACCHHYPGAQAWHLANLRVLSEPFPLAGKMGVFDVPFELESLSFKAAP